MTGPVTRRRATTVPVPDLAVCASVLLLMLLVVVLDVSGPVRAVVGVAAVLLVPGYALVAALFAPGLPEWSARAVLSCGLSIAVAALCCVVLNALGIRLETGVLVGWTAVIGLGALALAALRRRGHPSPARMPRVAPRALAINAAIAVALTGAVVVLIGVAREVRPVGSVPAGQVALYALPQGPGRLVVGLDGRNAPAGSYRVVVRSGRGARGLVRTYPVRLAAGSAWRTVVRVRPDAATEVLLYRQGQPATPIRRLVLRAPGA